jgi:hypothetical protein
MMHCSIIVVMICECARDVMMTGMTKRKLWTADRERLRTHFGRLDPETLRLRFGGRPDAGFLDAYIAILYQFGAADPTPYRELPNSENIRISRIAKGLGSHGKIADGEVAGRLDPPFPTSISLLDELFFDVQSFTTAVFDWPR